jgi:hypothetical protein
VRDETPPRPAHGDVHPLEVDTRIAQPARLQSYLAGGDAHFAADRELGEYLNRTSPRDDEVGVDIGRAGFQAQSAFTVRVVHYLVTQAGIRQFLSVGATVPMFDDVHQTAQRAAPESRVVFVGRDPVVLAHAHTLRTSSPEGATGFVHGGLRDPTRLLQDAAETLDLTQPVALLLVGVLNLIADERGPYGIVAQLMDAVPPGSHLAVAHPTGDIWPERSPVIAAHLSEQMRRPFVLRSLAEISRFFDGLELVEGGLVHIDEWGRQGDDPRTPARELIGMFGGVARKP